MSVLRQYATGGATWWRKSPTNVRNRAMLLAVSVPIAMYLMVEAAHGTKSFAVLYAGLSGFEASEVCKVLEIRGVEFHLDDGGRTIWAPVGKCAELRVELNRLVLNRVRFVRNIDQVPSGDVGALRGAPMPVLHNLGTTAQE